MRRNRGHVAARGIGWICGTLLLTSCTVARGTLARPDPARAHEDSLAAAVDAMAPPLLARHNVPSVAVALVTDGVVRWTRVHGEQGPGVPATARTLYNVASLTKPVFAELVLRLAAAGKLSLDEPMAPTWVDQDVAADPRHLALTPRVVLSQRSGFSNWRRETGGTLRFVRDPGITYGYSGEGYEYAARFVEHRLGASLDSLGRVHVFAPLGMTEAAFTRQPWFADRVAQPRVGSGQYGVPAFSHRGNAADDLYATIGSYAAFLAGVMRRAGLPEAYASQRDSLHALDPAARAQCVSTGVGRCPDSTGYALGWSVMRYAAHPGAPAETVLWHTGSDEGERAIVAYIPERRLGAVMLSNGANGFDVMIDIGMLLFRDTPFADYLRSGRR